MPFQVISNKAARRLKSDDGDKYKIMYVNRMKAFRPSKSMLEDYNEAKRRFDYRDDPKSYGLTKIHFPNMYRHYLMKSGDTMGVLRGMYEDAKSGDVYLVNESEIPITDVITDIIKSMSAVWK